VWLTPHPRDLIQPEGEREGERESTRKRKSLRSVCRVPQSVYLHSVDNIPAACSSADPGIWNDVEDCQVHLISNGSDSSSVWSEKFDAECSQADGDCMESSEKNGKVEKCTKLEGMIFPHKPTTRYMRINNEEIKKSTKSKEFEDIQSGNNKEENCESFVLPSSDAEFMKCQDAVGLGEPSSDVRSNEGSGENSKETIEKYGDWRNGDVKSDVRANGEEVLYNPIQTAPSQNEFRSPPRRPTRSSVRPSRFRDTAFVTEFQPR